MSSDWPKAAPTTWHARIGNVRCPDCGVSGVPEAAWTASHQHHETCGHCGRKFTAHGLVMHLAYVRRSTVMPA